MPIVIRKVTNKKGRNKGRPTKQIPPKSTVKRAMKKKKKSIKMPGYTKKPGMTQKKFPYTKAGIMAAKMYAKKTGGKLIMEDKSGYSKTKKRK